MNKETQNIIWVKFVKIAEDICSISTSLHFTDSEENKEKFFSLYSEYKDKLKDEIFYDVEDQNNAKLDSHKLASILYAITIKCKFIQTDKKDKYLLIEKTANEQAGVMLGLHLIAMFCSTKRKLYNLIELPKCNYGGSYLAHLLKLLSMDAEQFDIDKEPFDSKHLSYLSHIFFLLEKYTFKPQVKLTNVALSIFYVFLISINSYSFYFKDPNRIPVFALTLLFILISVGIKTFIPISISKILKKERF